MNNENKNSTRTIFFGQGDVNGILTPLIPFNCVYDIDFGLIRYMYEQGYTKNDEILDPGFFIPFSVDPRKIIIDLYNRPMENPLELVLRDTKDADALYNEFMQTHYEEIIRSSVHTGIYELCASFKNEKSIQASIIYSNEAEYYMLSKDKNLEHVELIDLDNLKHQMNEFNTFFFKSVDDMYIDLLTRHIRSSNVYILDYGFNIENNTIKDNAYITVLRLNRNDLNIISAYDRNRLVEGVK